MAVVTFSKQYIIDQLAGRVGALDIRVKEQRRIVDGLLVERAARDRAWMKKRIDLTDELMAKAKAMATLVKRTDVPPREIVDAANEWEKIAKRIIESRPTEDWNIRNRRDEAVRAIKRYEAELDLLGHATVYLQNTPIEEFSMTMLRSLGLLDVVKFDMASEKAKAAKKAA